MKARLPILLFSVARLACLSAQNAPQDPAASAATPAGLITTPTEMAPRVVTESLNLFGSAPTDLTVKHHSLRDLLPVPGQQVTPTSVNSCVAWTLSYSLLSYKLNLKANPRNPHYTYHWAILNDLKDERAVQLDDNGCTFASGYEALLNNGSCDLAAYNDFRRIPGPALSAKARQHCLPGLRPLKQLNTEDLFDLKTRLLRGRALPAGFRIYQGFGMDPKAAAAAAQPGAMFEMRTLGKGKRAGEAVPVWSRPGNTLPESHISKHAMLITGFDESIHAFEVMNSYGAGWGDGGYIWIHYDFFKKFSGESSPCCLLAYDYQDSIESFFEANGGRQEALTKVREGEATVYVRFGILKDGQDDIPQDELSFDIASLDDVHALQPGAVLTVRPGVGKLILRAGLVIDQKSGNTMLADQVGTIRSGDCFKISDIKRIRLESSKTYEYWLQGTVEPAASPR